MSDEDHPVELRHCQLVGYKLAGTVLGTDDRDQKNLIAASVVLCQRDGYRRLWQLQNKEMVRGRRWRRLVPWVFIGGAVLGAVLFGAAARVWGWLGRLDHP